MTNRILLLPFVGCRRSKEERTRKAGSVTTARQMPLNHSTLLPVSVSPVDKSVSLAIQSSASGYRSLASISIIEFTAAIGARPAKSRRVSMPSGPLYRFGESANNRRHADCIERAGTAHALTAKDEMGHVELAANTEASKSHARAVFRVVSDFLVAALGFFGLIARHGRAGDSRNREI